MKSEMNSKRSGTRINATILCYISENLADEDHE